ncbi:hypothetical protein INR49_001509, partial [Caranx melampygus]
MTKYRSRNNDKVLVALYEEPERPSNALEFVKQHLGAAGQISADTEALQQEVMDLRQRCERLAEENRDLKTRLQRHEPLPEDGATADHEGHFNNRAGYNMSHICAEQRPPQRRFVELPLIKLLHLPLNPLPFFCKLYIDQLKFLPQQSL